MRSSLKRRADHVRVVAFRAYRMINQRVQNASRFDGAERRAADHIRDMITKANNNACGEEEGKGGGSVN